MDGCVSAVKKRGAPAGITLCCRAVVSKTGFEQSCFGAPIVCGRVGFVERKNYRLVSKRHWRGVEISSVFVAK